MVDAREYHERTKHSPKSVREGGHRLDFENKPRPEKVYEDLPSRSLPEPDPPTAPALSAIAEPTPDGDPTRAPDVEALSTLCQYAAGITTELEVYGERREFRAAAATGALYHVDLYVVTGDLGGDGDGLEAGVYHFDPRSRSLDVLRRGDYRGVLAEASSYGPVADAPLSVVATSTWWRNAWKYRERTFRHAFWDSGTVLANLLAVAHALELRAEVVTGFADEPVADLLGIDPEREAPLELVAIGTGDDAPGPPSVEPIDPDVAPLSPTEKAFPLIYEAWAAGVLADGTAAEAWRTGRPDGPIGTREAGTGERVALEPVDRETASSRPLENTIVRRGSCREYDRESISFRKLSTVLDRAVRGVPMDVRREGCGGVREETADRENDPPLSFVDPYLVVDAVSGLESGTYHYHPEAGELERLRTGEFRREAGHLALDQRLGFDAAACIYFVTDLEAIVDALGDRGYRVAQLEAAVTAGRLYLATYAHRTLGGSGLTFYDDAVTDFFEPRASGQTPMFLYTLGRPATDT